MDSAILTGKVKTLAGKEVSLDQYLGKVVLIVNVASKCGLTPHYKGLQAMYDKYKDKGFEILGFPCNQFGGQEPGTAEEIQTFCSTKYNVTFPLFEKIDVNGPEQSPLYKKLTEKGGPIKWNFEKFVVGRDGKLVKRFGPRTEPGDKELVETIETALDVKKS